VPFKNKKIINMFMFMQCITLKGLYVHRKKFKKVYAHPNC